MNKASRRGVTLMEVLISITLLALLSGGMLTAMRVALSALGKTDAKLMENRRVAGAQRIIEEEIEGLLPAQVRCTSEAPVPGAPFRIPLFQGEPQSMRFVSTFSLQQAWRGRTNILEFTVIPGEEGRGVRLIVNEVPFTRTAADQLCIGRSFDPVASVTAPRFRPIEASPSSFVLADKLESCHFLFLEPPNDKSFKETWRPLWRAPVWPKAVRIVMVPLVSDPSRLQPITVTVPLHLHRDSEIQYVD
jgi:prepilin-type N-terminal cleavage/methylation domain-containing protein